MESRLLRRVFLSVVSVIMMIEFWSCNPEDVLITVRPAPSQIVVASQLLPGGFMTMLITRSFSALEGNEDSLTQDFLDQILVKNAEVTVTSNGREYILSAVDNVDGIYVSDTAIDLSTDSIKLQVFDPFTNRLLTSSAPVMPRLSPDTIRFVQEIEDEDTIQSLYFSFTDPVGDNWYAINAFDPGRFVDDIEADPFNLNGGKSGVFFDDLITDQVFEETIYSDTVRLDSLLVSDTIAFLFTNVSEGYFRFLDSRQRTGGIIASATSEPINTPTNIEGGLGFFNAHNPSITIVIKEEL